MEQPKQHGRPALACVVASVLALAAAQAYLAAGCEREGPAERVGEDIDEAVEDFGEAVEDVTEPR